MGGPEETDKQNKEVTDLSSNACQIDKNLNTDVIEISMQNKGIKALVTDVINSSSECQIDRNLDTDVTEISVPESRSCNPIVIDKQNKEVEAMVTDVINSSSGCQLDKNLANEETEISIVGTCSFNPVVVDKQNKETEAMVTDVINFSNECQIDKNPDTDVGEVSIGDTHGSNPVVKLGNNSKNNQYRDDSDSWSDDDDDDSSSSTSDTSSDADFYQILVDSSAPKKAPIVKTKGELGLEDLPPIEDLVISVEEEETMLIGKIHAVVDKLVVIHAVKDMKPLDLDSVLFLSHDKPLGRVFDIFGPVVEPFYCVRFNSTDDISEKGVEIGLDVFFAPEKSDITAYVFVDELQRQKGSDASWKHNNEPPEEFLDFSDDEEEKAARRKRMSKNRNRQFSRNSDVAPKRPTLAGDSSPHSNYRNGVCSTPQRNSVQYNQFPMHNPFADRPMPPLSPTPSICSVMSTPVRARSSFNRFPNPNQPRLPFTDPQRPSLQNVMQRSTPFVFAAYPPPPVFGQMALLSPMPSPSPFRPPVLNNVPALMPGSHPMTPNPYFNQRFPRNPSPVPQMAGSPRIFLNQGFPRNPSPVSPNQRTLPDPWIVGPPSPSSFHVPPTHPLTVQIPNQNNQSFTLHTFQPNSVPLQHLQPFVNNNINFHNGNVQTRFY